MKYAEPFIQKKRRTIGHVSMAAILLVAPPLAAEDGDDIQLEEIVVTAQKRAQSIIDVPVSITAYSSADLEKLRVQKVEDMLTVTPGVQYVETSDFLKTVSIRGLNDSGGGLFQTSGVTIDDATLVATYNGFLLTSRLVDIERVEVLRGPQGALTGSNSTSGTINIITKKPNLEDFEAEAMLDYGRFDSKILRGMVNVPLSNSFAVRAVSYLEKSDGSLKNTGSGGGGSTEDHYGARVAVRWQPTEQLTLDASFNYERQKFGAPNALTLTDPTYADSENDGRWWAETMRVNVGALEAAGGVYEDYDFINEVGLNGANISSDVAEKTKHELWYATFRGEYEMEQHTITALYTHYEHDVETLFDEDKSNFSFLTSSWDGGPKSNYAELRINSAYDGPFNWVLGGSYAKERRILNLKYDVTDVFLAGYYGLGDVSTLDVYNSPYYAFYWESTLEQIENKAIFGNVFWDISDRLHLSIGGRLSSVSTATESQFDTTGAFTAFNNNVVADETNFDPRIALNFDLADDITSYVQFATGYRAGYGNTGQGVELGVAPAEVEGEKVKNYEIGLKGRFFDRKLNIAGALFYMDYSNMQVAQTVLVDETIGEVSFDNNANSAVAKGFELEGDLLLRRNLVLSGGLSYVKSSIDEYTEGGIIYEDIAFPRVGPWTVDTSLEYQHDLSDNMWASFLANYSYRDGYTDAFPWLDVGDLGVIPSYNIVNTSVGIHQENWSVVAYMDNVFNETYWQGASIAYNTRGATVPYNARAFGVRFTIRN